MSLARRSAIVFGASGGIGTTVVRTLQSRGFDTLTSSRSQGDIRGDIGDADFVNTVFQEHYNKFDKIPDVVINTAAVQMPMGPIWDCPSEQIEANVRTNLIGPLNIVRIACAQMSQGSIILFAGGGSTAPRPGLTCYAVSKTAVVRLVENVYSELRWKGKTSLIINAIAPGAVATEMMSELILAKDRLPPQEIESAIATNQSGGTPPEKIGQLIDFLISPELHRGLSGKLIHVRESYAEFVDRYPARDYPADDGTLRRKGL